LSCPAFPAQFSKILHLPACLCTTPNAGNRSASGGATSVGRISVNDGRLSDINRRHAGDCRRIDIHEWNSIRRGPSPTAERLRRRAGRITAAESHRLAEIRVDGGASSYLRMVSAVSRRSATGSDGGPESDDVLFGPGRSTDVRMFDTVRKSSLFALDGVEVRAERLPLPNGGRRHADHGFLGGNHRPRRHVIASGGSGNAPQGFVLIHLS